MDKQPTVDETTEQLGASAEARETVTPPPELSAYLDNTQPPELEYAAPNAT